MVATRYCSTTYYYLVMGHSTFIEEGESAWKVEGKVPTTPNAGVVPMLGRSTTLYVSGGRKRTEGFFHLHAVVI